MQLQEERLWLARSARKDVHAASSFGPSAPAGGFCAADANKKHEWPQTDGC